MAKQVFINLAVKDPIKSMDFYTALGFTNNPQFSDEAGKCTKATIAGIYSLSLDSLEEVNKIVNNGLQAGGTEPNEMKDYGFMQLRSIEDLDGNTWEIFFMDITKIPAQ